MIVFDNFYRQFRSTSGPYDEIKVFSNQSVARKNIGNIDKAILHVFKLEYRFNYEYDHDKHIRDIAEWCMQVRIDMNKDKAKDPREVFRFYVINSDPEKKLPKWTKFLRNNYDFRGQLTQDDLNLASGIIIQLIGMRAKEDMIWALNNRYPL